MFCLTLRGKVHKRGGVSESGGGEILEKEILLGLKLVQSQDHICRKNNLRLELICKGDGVPDQSPVAANAI